MENVYICFDDCAKVEGSKVILSDVASVYCTNTSLQSKIRALKIYSFPSKNSSGDGDRVIMTALYAMELILQQYPDVTIIPTGSTDFILEKDTKHPSRLFVFLKAIVICLITFFGAAFTIMAFNNDVQVHEVFKQTYRFLTGAESDGFTALELGYSIGLGLGILIFYNHFGKKKRMSDPTPLQIEMRLYENEIHTALIDGVKRKNKHIDV